MIKNNDDYISKKLKNIKQSKTPVKIITMLIQFYNIGKETIFKILEDLPLEKKYIEIKEIEIKIYELGLFVSRENLKDMIEELVKNLKWQNNNLFRKFEYKETFKIQQNKKRKFIRKCLIRTKYYEELIKYLTKNNIKNINFFIRNNNITLNKINDLFYEKDKSKLNKMIKNFLEKQNNFK
jgi:hypothetical protein